jgi:AAA domain
MTEEEMLVAIEPDEEEGDANLELPADTFKDSTFDGVALNENEPTQTAGGWVPPQKTLRWRAPGKARDWVVPDMIPANFVHLLAGASGSGKSTLGFQLLEALNSGGDFMGYPVKPREWAYITADRMEDSIDMTQERMGMTFKAFSIAEHDLTNRSLTDAVFPMLTKFYGYKPKFIYIDGFTGLCPDGNSNAYWPVALWIISLQKYCNRHKITILGAVHCTKSKEGQVFTKPREKILGSAAWGAFTETVLLIEQNEGENEKDKRHLHILPRNGTEDDLLLTFGEDGWLTYHPQHIEAQQATEFIMSTILPKITLTPHRTFQHKTLWALAEAKGVNRRTFDRWLKKLVTEGRLHKKGKGIYLVPGHIKGMTVEALQPNPSLTHL